MSIVFNRTRRDFSERERALLELLRPALGNLYRHARALELARSPTAQIELRVAGLPLTPRERELVLWLARGKTDRDIAVLLGISPRTVHKHLQRAYAKLGVETRTAAVMCVLAHEIER